MNDDIKDKFLVLSFKYLLPKYGHDLVATESPETPQEDTSLHHLLPGRKSPRGGITPPKTAHSTFHDLSPA